VIALEYHPRTGPAPDATAEIARRLGDAGDQIESCAERSPGLGEALAVRR